MKKLFFLFILISILYQGVNAQRFLTKTGQISFYSDGPLEKIEALNKQVYAVLDTQTGDLAFKVLMKSFIFEKALMQEHFNENYVESDQFPHATFVGTVTNNEFIDYSKLGAYTATIEGKLTLHGQTRPVVTTGTFEVKANEINGQSSFFIKLDDYNIAIPGAVSGKIAEEIETTVNIQLKPLK